MFGGLDSEQLWVGTLYRDVINVWSISCRITDLTRGIWRPHRSEEISKSRRRPKRTPDIVSISEPSSVLVADLLWISSDRRDLDARIQESVRKLNKSLFKTYAAAVNRRWERTPLMIDGISCIKHGRGPRLRAWACSIITWATLAGTGGGGYAEVTALSRTDSEEVAGEMGDAINFVMDGWRVGREEASTAGDDCWSRWGWFPKYQRFLLATTRVCQPLSTLTGEAGSELPSSFFLGDMTLGLVP
ncbi:hypothetical protein J6590_034256 [Homalodisca vitripennis]|nr:hypothetical protein J6590_034256 [Homalodisca vitripennis]